MNKSTSFNVWYFVWNFKGNLKVKCVFKNLSRDNVNNVDKGMKAKCFSSVLYKSLLNSLGYLTMTGLFLYLNVHCSEIDSDIFL